VLIFRFWKKQNLLVLSFQMCPSFLDCIGNMKHIFEPLKVLNYTIIAHKTNLDFEYWSCRLKCQFYGSRIYWRDQSDWILIFFKVALYKYHFLNKNSFQNELFSIKDFLSVFCCIFEKKSESCLFSIKSK
jgi:hypothetical protein